MRLVKLSTDEFADETALQTYFADELPTRSPPGRFIFGHQIAANALDPGETVLFSYRGALRYVAKAETGRMKNTYLRQAEYPNCFVVKMASVKKSNIPLEVVERKLQAEIGLQKSLTDQGWTIIPNSELAEKIVEELIA